MAYGQKYHLSFTNQINEDYTIYFMRKDYSGGSTALTGSGETLRIKNNNDDDRFAPILSKEAIIDIDIRETQALGITDFLAVEDDDWNVVIYKQLGEPAIFNGFLVVEDSSQPLHDRPLQLHLRASDGLPLLKNVPLKMSDGTDFTGLNNITDYIGHILYYINPDIGFKVYFDIFHVDMDTDDCPLEQTQIDCKTFEKDETTFLDMYACLEMLMKSFVCSIEYENGLWHVVNKRQYIKDTFNWWQFSMISNVVTAGASNTGEVIRANIGKNELIKFINKDAVIFYKVASKFAKLTYNYETPKEIICNQQLHRGVKNIGLSTPEYDAIDPTCWEHIRWRSELSPVNDAYIKREKDVYDYEKERYLILPTETSATGSAQWMSSSFPMGINDKATISVETRLFDGYSGGQNSLVFYVLLFGDDGTFWTLDDNGTAPNNEGLWVQSDATFGINRKAISYVYGASDDKTQWVTASVDSSGAPVNGIVQLVLSEHSFNDFPNRSDFKNIRIDYHAFVAGGYAPVKGDYNIYEQNLKINKTVDETVNISDSPSRIFKGTLFVNNLLATPEWFRLGITESLRFTQQMALLKYHFAFVQFQKIEGTLKGLSLLNNNLNTPSGFLPQYSLTDLNSPTLLYILTSLDINYHSGHWHAVLVECQLNGPTTYDTYDFTYLFE